MLLFIFYSTAAQRGLWPPHPRDFLITHNGVPQSVGLLLDEWSARRRDFYPTTHNRQTSMLPVGFEHTIAVGERL
jgi:hypothetical protein